MNGDEFEARLRQGDWFASLTLPPGMWCALRLDGRSFGWLTRDRFDQPYDWRVLELMVESARSVMTDVGGIYGYTHSDEISVLLPPSFDGFGRRLEKLVSLGAAAASARFTARAGFPAHFDARVWVGATADDVVDYFTWRQADAARTALDQWCRWTLRRAGHEPRAAEAALDGLGTAEKNDLLFRHGVTFNDVPTWQRRGAALYYRTPPPGLDGDPSRPRLDADTDLTSRDEYRAFVRAVLDAAA